MATNIIIFYINNFYYAAQVGRQDKRCFESGNSDAVSCLKDARSWIQNSGWINITIKGVFKDKIVSQGKNKEIYLVSDFFSYKSASAHIICLSATSLLMLKNVIKVFLLIHIPALNSKFL